MESSLPPDYYLGNDENRALLRGSVLCGRLALIRAFYDIGSVHGNVGLRDKAAPIHEAACLGFIPAIPVALLKQQSPLGAGFVETGEDKVITVWPPTKPL